MIKKLLTIVLVAILAVALGLIGAACKGTVAEETAAKTEVVVEKILVGLSFPDIHDAALAAMKKGVVEGGPKMTPPVEVLFTSADGDVTKQAADIKDLISKKVDIMVLFPLDSKAIAASIKDCQDAGIPTLGYCRAISADSEYQVDVFSGIDAEAQGYDTLKATFAKMKEDGIKSTGVIVVSGDLRDENSTLRVKGFQQACDEEGVKILVDVPGNWDPVQAAAGLAPALKAFPDANTFATCSDTMLSGIMEALEDADKWAPRGEPNHMYFASCDVFPEAVEWIQADYIDADTLYDCFGLSDQTLDIIQRMAAGEEFNGEWILIGGPVYDSSNVDTQAMIDRMWQ